MKTSYFKSSLALAACLVLTVSLPAQKNTSGTVVQYNKHDDSGKDRMDIYKNGKRYLIEFTEDKLTSLTIDGVSIPQEKWGEYEAFITETREQMKRDRAQAAEDRKQAEKDREQAKLDRVQAEKDREQAMKDREHAKLDRVQSEKDRAQAVKDRAQADLDRAQAEKDRAQAGKDREQAQLDRIQAEKDRAQAAEDRKLLADLTNDLVNDKLIADTKDLRDFTLNSSGMTVNGQKQPENIVKKYREKYDRFAKRGMTYSSDGYHKQFSTGNNN